MSVKFGSIKELVSLAEQNNTTIGKIVIRYEAETSQRDTEDVIEQMRKNLNVMCEAARKGLETEVKSMSGLVGGDARKLEHARLTRKSLIGDIVAKALARGMAIAEVNASMGKIVAAPTAGSCGILPGAVITVAEFLNCGEEKTIESLFTAGGIGIVIDALATMAGAEGGCQAECGSASAMAAAAVVELAGGTPSQAGEAVAIALKSMMGLVCDPVAGLVEVPCVKRNATGTANALISAELALAGIKSAIPVDEVIVSMKRVGEMMPVQLRETAQGGIALTPTALKIERDFLKY